MLNYKLSFLILIIILAGCQAVTQKNSNSNNLVQTNNSNNANKKIGQNSFGKTADNQEAILYILKNSKGTEVHITNYGATITMLKTADKNGKFDDIVLGFDSVTGYTNEAYLKSGPYFGATIGRFGNRIAKAKFSLNGADYQLQVNNGVNNLHGGKKGFDKVFWQGQEIQSQDGLAVEFTYLSKDGEEGFPGNLTAKVVYTLTENNELKIDYTATTDKDTIVNLTHHSYFNLAGQGNGDILSHLLKIEADKFTPIDKTLIPFGELKSVEKTPFDFRQAKEIGKEINANDEQIKNGSGYDHNFVVNGEIGKLRLAATVTEPKSGRKMEVLTTEPGIQLYTGNFLDGSLTGKDGKVYNRRFGFCLETQHFPDSPNQKDYPSTVLKVGETYKSSTIYKFATD